MRRQPAIIAAAAALAAVAGCASRAGSPPPAAASSIPGVTPASSSAPGNEWGYEGKGFISAPALASAIKCVNNTQPPAGWQSYVRQGVECDIPGPVLRTWLSAGNMLTAVTVTLYYNRDGEQQSRADEESNPMFAGGAECMTLGPGWIVATAEGGGTGVCRYVQSRVGGTVDGQGH